MVASHSGNSERKEWMTYKELRKHYGTPEPVIREWVSCGNLATIGRFSRLVNVREFERLNATYSGPVDAGNSSWPNVQVSPLPQSSFSFSRITIITGVVSSLIAAAIFNGFPEIWQFMIGPDSEITHSVESSTLGQIGNNSTDAATPIASPLASTPVATPVAQSDSFGSTKEPVPVTLNFWFILISMFSGSATGIVGFIVKRMMLHGR